MKTPHQEASSTWILCYHSKPGLICKNRNMSSLMWALAREKTRKVRFNPAHVSSETYETMVIFYYYYSAYLTSYGIWKGYLLYSACTHQWLAGVVVADSGKRNATHPLDSQPRMALESSEYKPLNYSCASCKPLLETTFRIYKVITQSQNFHQVCNWKILRFPPHLLLLPINTIPPHLAAVFKRGAQWLLGMPTN